MIYFSGVIEQFLSGDCMTRPRTTVTMTTATAYDGTQRWDEFCSTNWNGKDKIWCTQLPFQVIANSTITSITTQTQHTYLQSILRQITDISYHHTSFIQNTGEENGIILSFTMKYTPIKILSDHSTYFKFKGYQLTMRANLNCKHLHILYLFWIDEVFQRTA